MKFKGEITMNTVQLLGRLTTDAKVTYTTGENAQAIANFTLAVDRQYGKGADFIRCVAFGKRAEALDNFCKKGTKIAVVGSIQTGSYEKDGVKHYTTDVIVNSFDFCEKKEETVKETNDKFINIPDGIEEELPFN